MSRPTTAIATEEVLDMDLLENTSDEDDGFEDDGFDDCPAWLEIPPGILFQCESLVTTKWLERYYCLRPPFSKFCSFSVRLAAKCKWVTAFPPKGRT